MAQKPQIYQTFHRESRVFTWGDLLAVLLVGVLFVFGIRLAFGAPESIAGPDISLSPGMLPWYTALSVGRMTAAYALSIVFSILYGRTAAYHRRAEKVLLPLLDVLQSVPILSFLPVVLLSLSAVLPEKAAVELASIVLIFTSQAWNLTFAWYQSLTTIPKELREAGAIFRLNAWMKFKFLELPFGMISLVWNSMMSWAGGWFFLMAAEIFTVGARDFRLPGLGAYLHEAANRSDFRAIGWGIAVLILTIVLLDQFVWRPLLAWAERFKVEMVVDDNPPTSWFYTAVSNARLVRGFTRRILQPLADRFDRLTLRLFPLREGGSARTMLERIASFTFLTAIALGCVFPILTAGEILASLPPSQWGAIGLGLLATTLRVSAALLIALAWTVPLGVAIGTNRQLAAVLQPIVQVIASVPATALFPVILLAALRLPGGLNLASIILMLMGTQWYLLFNIIAGASAIPQDLKYTTQLLQLSRRQRWQVLILPAIFPYMITGAITASGGAWNASIIAEYQEFGGETLSVNGIGSIIAQATARGDYPHLLAATLAMVVLVVLINRLVWRRFYLLAEEKYRME